MKVDFVGKCAKIKMDSDERLEITLPSGKVIKVESFASPDFEEDSTMIECVKAPKERKIDREASELNGYLWSYQKKEQGV